MSVRPKPLLTRIYDDHTHFRPIEGSAYLALQGIEERSRHSSTLLEDSDGVTFLDVIREGDSDLDVRVRGESAGETFRLRSRKQLAKIWKLSSAKTLYLDITGLRHHIWIPLLRSALESVRDVRVVYAEPGGYRPSLTPTEGQIYDLSERIGGISPIPGFAALGRTREDFLFIPLLGFEGTRVAHLIEQLQPIDDRIVPVVGVPGFRPEYPFISYLGNRIALTESNAWRRVRFADANCPFALFYLLETIQEENHGAYSKVAVVGTKPHALGAALFVIRDSSRRELVYDHPIRKSERTFGIARVLEYGVGEFHVA